MSINVTLPSNASEKLYPRNTQASYRTRLANPLHLHGKWSVALTEVHIPRTWYNINNSNNTFRIVTVTPPFDKTPDECLTSEEKFSVKPGYYATPKSLVQAVNESIPKHKRDTAVDITYNENLNRAEIRSKAVGQALMFTKMESALGEMLGMKPSSIGRWLPEKPCSSTEVTVHTAKYAPDVTGGFTGVYIYTDIVEHQYVGDTMAQLLRVVPVDRKGSYSIYHIFDKPHYIPVLRERIDTIEIDIRTDYGEPIIFGSGKVVVKLHFKRDNDE